MSLNDYYAPLNFFNLLIFLFFFLSLDIVGNYWASFFKFPKFLRAVNWVFGLGIFIFIWFLLHIFLPLRQDYITVSLILFVMPFLPQYIKCRGVIGLVKVFYNFPYPLIFLLLIIQKLFFLLSMPPYVTDELAYHYSSPVEIMLRLNWDFGHNINFYYMIPQTMEVGFRLMFSLTQTYAAARLLHFAIFLTAVYSIAYFLKEKVNTIVACAYSLFILLLFTTPLVDSTRGYIDVAPAILANLLLIISIGGLFTKERGYFYAAVVFAGFIAGIKYTTLGFILSLTLFLIPSFLLINRKEIGLSKISFKKHLSVVIIATFLFMAMGGYWYIKNIIIVGNPIYPFVFKCKNNIPCGNKSEFFNNFGIQFRIENLPRFLQVAEETMK